MSFSLSGYTKIDVGWGFTPLWELTALPRPSSWFQGGRFAAGGEWREGLGEEEGMERGNGEGEVGKLGNSALVVGGIDASVLGAGNKAAYTGLHAKN